LSKRKGARTERKVIRILEAAGYYCTKAGGSLGVFDVVALDRNV
jgi:Holliday junction resolvase